MSWLSSSRMYLKWFAACPLFTTGITRKSAMMKLDHIVILLSNMETCLGFYEALLPMIGFRKDRDHVFVNAEEIYLDFRQSGEPDHGYHRFAPGLNHMGFTLKNLAEVADIQSRMQQAGFAVPDIQEFEDSYALFLKDSDGMRIELACAK